jgi:hypothetical protein
VAKKYHGDYRIVACPECHKVFSNEEVLYEDFSSEQTQYGWSPPETSCRTPCGCNEHPDEAETCEVCGEDFHPHDLIDGICPECRKDEE